MRARRTRSCGLDWAVGASLVAISVVASSLLAFASGRAAAGDDPLEWRPPSSKAQFRKLLSDADYARRSASIVNRLPQARKEAATKLPDHGLKISGVFAPARLRRRVSR